MTEVPMIGAAPGGVWSVAHHSALVAPGEAFQLVPPRAFEVRRVRQWVRLRAGGTRVRPVLSHQFGIRPLVLAAVEVGGRPARLCGAGRWVIPPGHAAVGDPVDLPVRAGDELEITVRVAEPTEPASYLPAAQRTGTAIGPAGATESFTSRYWISDVLVDAAPVRPTIVAFGDSITAGDGTTVDADGRYPDRLAARLADAGTTASVLNSGISGNRLLRAVVGPSGTDRFDRDVVSLAGVTHTVIMLGTNDIGLPHMTGEPRPTATEIVDGLLALAGRARERGIQAILGTITPFGGSAYAAWLQPGNEAVRLAVNEALRAQTEWPVVDFAAAYADPADPGRVAPAYDSGDGVHPNDAGAAALAAAVDLRLFTG